MLHVVGAGLAGLAASVAATQAGWPVTLHESTDHAGGRCRSFHDPSLNTVIDNGTHLVMDVNQTAIAFARTVGGIGHMHQGRPHFPFINLSTGQHWTLSPFALARRPLDLLKAVGAFGLAPHTTVAQSLARTKTYHTIWDPLNVAALNTSSDQASAQLFAQLLRMALKQGLSALNPWVFPQGLSAAFVEPALHWLRNHNAKISFNHRLRAVEHDALIFDDQRIQLSPEDRVILALPPWIAHGLFPDFVPQLETRSIVNGHFQMDRPVTLPGGMPWLGITGGLGQWISLRDGMISVTISAAEAVVQDDAQSIAQTLWHELSPHLNLPLAPIPPHKIIKEKRATLAHTPDQIVKRPPPTTPYSSMILAGDWLASPWPCTIEAAIASGLQAARLITGNKSIRF